MNKIMKQYLAVLMAAIMFIIPCSIVSVNAATTASIDTVDEGIYYIKNVEFDKYMQIDDGGSGSGAIMELWNKDGADDQLWKITCISGNYYSIVSVESGLALSVQSGNLNTASKSLVQETYTGAYRQQWSFEDTTNGYIIRPRSGESYTNDWCMAAGTGIFTSNGRNVEQREYTDNNDYKDLWILEPYSVIFYGVTNSGHDHSSALSAIQSDLLANKWNSVVLRMGAISSSRCKSDLLSTNIFTSRSHGQIVLYSGSTTGAATGILLNDKTGDASVHFYSHSWSGMNSGDSNIESNEDYSNVDVALFIGCETAYGGVGQRNLPTSIVNCGATASVGFTESIGCSAANTWTTNFYSKMRSGATLEEAVEYACNLASESSGLKSAVICGDGTIVFPQ